MLWWEKQREQHYEQIAKQIARENQQLYEYINHNKKLSETEIIQMVERHWKRQNRFTQLSRPYLVGKRVLQSSL